MNAGPAHRHGAGVEGAVTGLDLPGVALHHVDMFDRDLQHVGGKAGVGPQEFIGYSSVPEPGSITLLGTGLIGLAGVLRRKFAKA